MFDPFLMFDDFRQDDPAKYLPGFPWHPHRGIETITYMIRGGAEHGDSLGNAGVIGPGDVQWMTAGSGVIHQEMPKGGPDGRMGGFQLLGEPVAWRGPIVMNTQEELQAAFREYRNGTFIKPARAR